MLKQEEKKVKNIYQRILDVMRIVKYIKKEDKKVNGQYTFVSHDAVTSAIHDALIECGIAVIPTTKTFSQDGNRTSVELLVTFVNVDEPSDFIQTTYWGYGIDTQDKGPGKAVSYAFKYAILKTFCLETGDDPEKDMIEKSDDKKTSFISKEKVNEIRSLHNQLNENLKEKYKLYISDALKANGFEEIKECDYKRVIESYKKAINSQNK